MVSCGESLTRARSGVHRARRSGYKEFDNRIPADSLSADLQGGIEDAKDARLMVRLRSPQEAGATQSHLRRRSTRSVRIDPRRVLIWLENPHVAVAEIREERAEIAAGNFSRPNDLRVINVRLVVNKFVVDEVLLCVAYEDEMFAGHRREVTVGRVARGSIPTISKPMVAGVASPLCRCEPDPSKGRT